MSHRATNWAIAAMLLVQLVVGLQWQVAHAVAPLERPMSGMEAGHCPSHEPRDSQAPGEKHDCCRSLGCQCDNAQSPGLFDLPRVDAAFSTLILPAFFGTRGPVARTNELFRPPIP